MGYQNSRARVDGKTLEQRIYAFIKRARHPVNTTALYEHFGQSRSSIRGTCLRLRRKGCIVAHGATNRSVAYTATRVAPDDLRGLAVGSIAALNRANPPKIGRVASRRPKAEPGIELEAVWRTP